MKYKLAQLYDIDIEVIDGDRGKNYPHKDELLETGYCLFLSAKNVTQSGFSFSDNQFIAKEKDQLLNKGKLNRGDIVITTRGTVGNVALYSDDIPYENVRINSGMLIVRCGESIDNFYLYQVMRSKWFYNQLLSIQSGSAQPQLPKSHFLQMNIPLPDIETQKRIANILLSINEKIVVNTAINKNLEQQVQMIYKNLLQNCESFCELGSVVETTSGGTPSRKKKEYYQNGEICWIKSKELHGTYIVETEEKITEKGLSFSSAKILPSKSVLIAMYGATVGEYGIISKPMTCNQAICALIPNENYPYSFLYVFAKTNKQNLINLAVGSAQQNISQELIKQIPICSDIGSIKKFHSLVNPIFLQIELLVKENKHLSDIRDNLIPKLMNGEIDVSDVKI